MKIDRRFDIQLSSFEQFQAAAEFIAQNPAATKHILDIVGRGITEFDCPFLQSCAYFPTGDPKQERVRNVLSCRYDHVNSEGIPLSYD